MTNSKAWLTNGNPEKKKTTIFYKVQLLWTSLRSSSDRNIAKLSQSPILCYSFKLLSVHLLWLKSNAWNMPKTSFLLTGSCTESRNCCLLSSLLVKKCLMAVFVVLARNNMFFSVRYTVCTNKNFRQWQSKNYWMSSNREEPPPSLHPWAHKCTNTVFVEQVWCPREVEPHQCLPGDVQDFWNTRKTFRTHIFQILFLAIRTQVSLLNNW